jgi:hypothetical protein
MHESNPDTVVFDFATTIGQKKKGPTPLDPERVWLPPRYNQNSKKYRVDTLAPLFSTACVQAGFELIIKGWEGHRNCIRFCCYRGRRHSDSARAQRVLKVRTYLLLFVLFVLSVILVSTHRTSSLFIYSSFLCLPLHPTGQHLYENAEAAVR